MILYGNELIKKIRSEFENAKSRIWIAVPFIGSWNEVKKIMGTRWIHDLNIHMRILTDIRNEGFINPLTIKQFLHRSEVKTLSGLHAKIYIIDNSVFITSANLTGTAFSKRYEICYYTKLSETSDLNDLFENWWDLAKVVSVDWEPEILPKTKNSEKEAGNFKGLKRLWKLPDSSVKIRNFNDYQDYITIYNHFKSLYFSDSQRLLPNLTEYHEMDAFLNYLFHEDENKPSHSYLEEPHRKLNNQERIREIKKYKNRYKKWISKNPKFEEYRKKWISTVQSNLSKSSIDDLDTKNLEEVASSLHTMNSHALNKHRFLNPQNNDIDMIIDSFKILIHGEKTIEERMEICNKNLKYFGKSSIRELVSWYYPDKYPIVNRNSNSGLKYFGYEIDVY